MPLRNWMNAHKDELLASPHKFHFFTTMRYFIIIPICPLIYLINSVQVEMLLLLKICLLY